MTDDEPPAAPAAGPDQDPVASRYFLGAPPEPGVGTAPGFAGDSDPAQPQPVPALPALRVPRRRRRRLRAALWTIVGVLVLAVVVSSRIDLNYYAIQPGGAQSVQAYITVPADRSHPVSHPVLLTDVREARVTALTYLFFRYESGTALYPVDAVTGGTAAGELDAQGALEMSQAEQDAETAALRHLGYPVPATPAGAVIFGTFVGTPAYGLFNVGDVVVAVDGRPTLTAVGLTQVLAAYHSGQTVTFSVRRGGRGRPVPVPLTLRRTAVNVDGQTLHLNVGIEPQDQIDYTYPFAVSINVADIGGPSAGLAMTLGLIDALGSGSLTGGHTVAATGTIDANGDVGQVGGVAQKTIAVEGAGASVFLVPPGANYQAAMSEDRPGLRIYSVSTLDQALQDLASIGGHVQPSTLDTAVATAAG